MLLLFSCLSVATAEPRRILFLHSLGPDFSPYNNYISKLRMELARQSAEPMDIYETSLSTARLLKVLVKSLMPNTSKLSLPAGDLTWY